MKGISVGFALIVSVFGTWNTAIAYDVGGHMYTASLISHQAAGVASNDADIITFCTQLPDYSSDLDATAVYFDMGLYWGSAWDLGLGHGSIPVRRMVTIQRLLHGLTGGDAKELNTAATVILSQLSHKAFGTGLTGQQRADALCALGFAVHLYGDSFAHRLLVARTMDPEHTCGDSHPLGCMYDTGVGHARRGHYPDWPLCSYTGCDPSQPPEAALKLCAASTPAPPDTTNALPARYKHWIAYGHGLTNSLAQDGTGGHLNDPASFDSATVKLFCNLEESAEDGNGWNDRVMGCEMVQIEEGKGIPNTADCKPDGSNTFTYQTYLDNSLVGILLKTEKTCDTVVKGSPLPTKPSCESAWQAYWTVACKEFLQTVDAGDSEYKAVYMEGVLDDPASNSALSCKDTHA